MNRQTVAGLLLALFLLGISPFANAQFQGHITMNLYSSDEDGGEVQTVNLYATGNRLFFEGVDKVDLAANSGIDPTGILIRNDEKDFVILTDKNEALKITKTEIESFLSMMTMMESMSNSGNGAKKEEKAPNIKYSNQVKKINGFNASELIYEFTDGENKGDYLSIWLTPNVDINWGILSEPWKNLPKDMELAVNSTLRQNIFTGNNFPVLIEAYDAKKGKLEKVMDVAAIEKTQVAPAKVNLPQGVKLLGLNDLMMKIMSNK